MAAPHTQERQSTRASTPGHDLRERIQSRRQHGMHRLRDPTTCIAASSIRAEFPCSVWSGHAERSPGPCGVLRCRARLARAVRDRRSRHGTRSHRIHRGRHIGAEVEEDLLRQRPSGSDPRVRFFVAWAHRLRASSKGRITPTPRRPLRPTRATITSMSPHVKRRSRSPLSSARSTAHGWTAPRSTVVRTGVVTAIPSISVTSSGTRSSDS